MWVGAAQGDTSSSSWCLMQRVVLMVSACSVIRLLFFTASLGWTTTSQHVQDVCLHDDSFSKRFSSSPFFSSLASVPEFYHVRCLLLPLRDKWTSCEWQEVQIKDGTEYFLERWAAMEEMSWHKEFNNAKMHWIWEPGGGQAALACNKCMLVHSCSISGF